MQTFIGIMIPFLGTALGSVCVFFMKKSLGDLVQRALAGFAAGVMVAASIWSLLIPAIEQSEGMGKLSFLPAFIGFWVGVLFLLLLDRLIPHLHIGSDKAEGPKSKLGRTTMMVLAVTLHNIPEGMAVGVMYAGFLAGNSQITAASALVLSLGIAIQNFPEGAIISMPLKAEGESKSKAFLGGVLSGVVEPVGAVLTLLAAQLASYILCDVLLSVVMIVMIWKKMLPLKNTAQRILASFCNPIVFTGIVGNLFTLLPWPLNQIDHGTESAGHLLVLALGLVLLREMAKCGECKETVQ